MSTQQPEVTFEQVWDMFQETARRFQETDQKFQETDQKFRETDLKFKETERVVNRTSREIEKLSKQVADLTGSWGKFVESMVEPALVRLFGEREVALVGTATRVRKRLSGEEIEIDILGVDDTHVVAVEVKTALKVSDVKDHLERLQKFKRFFPEYQDRVVLGAVAGMRIEEDADKFAYRQGLYVLAQTGETVQILNDENFAPREW